MERSERDRGGGNVGEPTRERAVAVSPRRSADGAFDATPSGRRREVLSRLIESGGELSLVELADRLSPQRGDVASCRAVYLELYHTHVPVLESAGLLDWNRADGTLRATDRTDRFDNRPE